MAWTAPQTWVANAKLTAADLNTHLRDNLLETAVAKATVEGGLIVATGPNTVVERQLSANYISNSESTTSSSYTNLATVGPQVTVTTGTTAIVMIACGITNSVSLDYGAMSWAVSGATTVAASGSTAFLIDGIPSGNLCKAGSVDVVTTLTPGSNTFTAKYSCFAGNTATFSDRFICVIPL